MTHKNPGTVGTTGELNFVEDTDAQIVWVTTPKRRKKIKIFVPVGNYARWHIAYEDGSHVENLSNGTYLSRKAAIYAVVAWDTMATQSQDARLYELFGDKEPPVLKRKPVRGARAKANTS